MSPKGGGFTDGFDDLLREAAGMTDKDLERLLAGGDSRGGPRKATEVESLEPGTNVEGVVVDLRGGEVLLDLDGKTVGVINESEFSGADLPEIGSRVRAQFERFDKAKDLAVLSVGGVRKEIFWEEIRRGSVLEGTVTATNKGGLTVDVKGARAFVPISQIERARVEDLAPYVGQRLRFEVTEVDRSSQNIVGSRRIILEREGEKERQNALARLGEGEVLKGRVVRVTDHGAFIDLGGVDGLIPAAKIQAQLRARTLAEPLAAGQEVHVQVMRVDRERGRVSLDLKTVAADTWKRAIEGLAPGDEVTGWVSRSGPSEVVLTIDEGLQGVISEEYLHLLGRDARPGAILKVAIAGIDAEKRLVKLRPLPAPQGRKP